MNTVDENIICETKHVEMRALPILLFHVQMNKMRLSL